MAPDCFLDRFRAAVMQIRGCRPYAAQRRRIPLFGRPRVCEPGAGVAFGGAVLRIGRADIVQVGGIGSRQFPVRPDRLDAVGEILAPMAA